MRFNAELGAITLEGLRKALLTFIGILTIVVEVLRFIAQRSSNWSE